MNWGYTTGVKKKQKERESELSTSMHLSLLPGCGYHVTSHLMLLP